MNAKNSRNSTIVPQNWNCPVRLASSTTADEAIRITLLVRYCLRVSSTVMNSTAMAKISAVFAVTEPTALPTAMSTLPSTAAMTDTIISGSVVARLTIVAPTINFGMPETSAIQLAASTKRSPPLTISTRPITNNSSSTQMDMNDHLSVL